MNKDFSASPDMKMFVSTLLRKRQFRIISSSGSTSLLRNSQISPITIKAFLLRDDLSESAQRMTCNNKE